MEYLYISIAQFINMKDRQKKIIPLYITVEDELVFCTDELYGELLEKTNNLTVAIDCMIIVQSL